MLGPQIHRYRIVEQIGSGGMAVVYKGVDTTLDREVAVKVLHPHLASKAESRRRFSREAKAVARLHHRNVLEVYDFSGEDVSESYIVTEYIRGKTLRRFADEEPFHPPEVAAMAVYELASALEHAHVIGVIHRDLKLMDFGIAKIVDRDERMTMTGALVGSPAHMAPEVIEGVEAGAEADIFALGTIFYWLCTRKLPFAGNNTTQTLKLILDGTYTDPRIENPAVSDDIAQVIAGCLAREPAARYPTASALREALAALLSDAGVEHPGDDLALFSADPKGFRAALSKNLVARLVDRASGFVRAGRNPKALDCVNRVLALEPANERALQLLARMKRRRRLNRVLGAAAFVFVLCSAAGGTGVYVATRPPPLPPPPVIHRLWTSPDAPEIPRPPAAPHLPRESPWKGNGKAKSQAENKPEAQAPAATTQMTVTVWHVRADILLDGTKIGEKNLTDYVAPVGRHTLRIVNPCCETYEQAVELEPGVHFQVPLINLKPRPATLTVEIEGGGTGFMEVRGKTPEGWAKIAGGPVGRPVAVPMIEEAGGEGWEYQRRLQIQVLAPGKRFESVELDVHAGTAKTLPVRPSSP